MCDPQLRMHRYISRGSWSRRLREKTTKTRIRETLSLELWARFTFAFFFSLSFSSQNLYIPSRVYACGNKFSVR